MSTSIDCITTVLAWIRAYITLCKILLCHHSWWEAVPREAVRTSRDLSDGSSCDICFHKLSWALILHTEPQLRDDEMLPYKCVGGWQAKALYFSIRQLNKWSGPLEVVMPYQKPPHTHTPWTFVPVVKGGWYAKRSPPSRMLLFLEVQMTHFLVTERICWVWGQHFVWTPATCMGPITFLSTFYFGI